MFSAFTGALQGRLRRARECRALQSQGTDCFSQPAAENLALEGPVGIVKRNARTGRTDILVVYNWMHLATLHDENELQDLSLRGQAVTFDLDSYKLLIGTLLDRTKAGSIPHRVIELPAIGEPDVLMP